MGTIGPIALTVLSISGYLIAAIALAVLALIAVTAVSIMHAWRDAK